MIILPVCAFISTKRVELAIETVNSDAHLVVADMVRQSKLLRDDCSRSDFRC